MGCSSCGGGSIPKAITRLSRPKKTIKIAAAPISVLRPKPTQKLIESSAVLLTAKKRSANMKMCPMCGSLLVLELVGSGHRKRRRCRKCNKTFAM